MWERKFWLYWHLLSPSSLFYLSHSAVTKFFLGLPFVDVKAIKVLLAALHIPCDFQFQLSFNSISVSWRNVTTFMLGTCPVPICIFSLRLCLNSVRSLQISQADLLLSLPDFLHIVMGFMLWSGCPSISTYLSTCQRLLAFWDCHWQDIAYFFPEWAKIF